MCLVAIIDWLSRFVLTWELLTTLDIAFCLEALELARKRFGTSGIFNTNERTQFASEVFTSRLKAAEVSISIDRRERVYDNIFVDRLWSRMKCESL